MLVKDAQFLAQSNLTGKRLLAVKAIRGVGIKFEMKAQFNDQQGMFEQKATKLTGVDHAFANANQKGFEVGTFRMSGSSTSRALLLPLVDEGPIEQGKESAVVLNHRVMLKQSCHR